MNRAERRRVEKENKQQFKDNPSLQKWFNNWTPAQKQFHKQMVGAIVDEVQETTEKIMDSCYIAAMLQETELSLNQCVNICKQADKHMVETRNIIELEGEGYLNMIKNEKLRDEIREEAKKMLKEGQVMSKGVTELKNRPEYKKLAVKDISIIWAEAKEEVKGIHKEPVKTQNIKINVPASEEEKAEYMNKAIKRDFESVKVCTELTKSIEEAEKIMCNVTNKGLITEDKNGFKIFNLEVVNITLKGQCGTYQKSTEGVITDDTLYKNIEEVAAEKENFNSNVLEEEKALVKKLEELREYRDTENAKYEELKQVFNM